MMSKKTPERSPSATNSASRVLNLLTPGGSSRVQSPTEEPAGGQPGSSTTGFAPRKGRWSLRRNKSKGDKPDDISPNTEIKNAITTKTFPSHPVELPDSVPVELPGSEPDPNLDARVDFPIWVECDEVSRAIDDIQQKLARLAFLQRRSLADPDSAPNTSTNTELYKLSYSVMLLCRQSIRRLKEVVHSPDSAGFKSMMAENSRKLSQSMEGFMNAEMEFTGQLRDQMVANYKIAIPEASDTEARAAFEDEQNQRITVSYLQSDHRTNLHVKAAIQTIKHRQLILQEGRERITELSGYIKDIEHVLINLLDRPQHNQASEAGKSNIYESKIDSEGDIILDFVSGDINYSRLQFQVSSHMISKTSPLFARALKPPVRPRDPVPPGMEGELPTLMPARVTDQAATMIFMPQKEHSIGALSILLYAAHMRNDKVPRSITFREFVEVARVCLRYQCIDPVALFVELLWLPQWQEKIGQAGYGDFLLISYVFGHARIFEACSKRVILQLRGEGDIMEDKMLPGHVRDRLRECRATSLSLVLDHCRKTITQYLPPSPMQEAHRVDQSGLAPMDWSFTNRYRLQNSVRCSKDDRQCDANNLGWLMLIFNEVGILHQVMHPTLKPNDGTWYSGTLGSLIAKLCAVPSAPKIHEGDCDYAPAFRSRVCDIFNQIKGLELSDLNTNYASRKRPNGTLHSERPKSTDMSPRRSLVDTEENPVPALPATIIGQLAKDTPASHRAEPAWYENEITPSPFSRTSTGVSLQSTLNGTARRNSETDTHSIASTDITVPTGRPNSPSPSFSTLRSFSSGIVTPLGPGQVTVPLANRAILNHSAQVNAMSSASDRDPIGERGTQEDEKVYWQHRAAKEIIKVEDKELIISHKHTIRLGEEMGIPPLPTVGQAASQSEPNMI